MMAEQFKTPKGRRKRRDINRTRHLPRQHRSEALLEFQRNERKKRELSKMKQWMRQRRLEERSRIRGRKAGV